ncbi:GntR family transcriptional regulator [Microbacterium sp. ABRD28]|uniref:GntR family transcriptional regulator n=1 Tax=Microbacterium sp. ABRD28 TaxID=2268461 RepID=UPI000F54E196|nr:GntR family transcriptional regulator [Microbacterium sp. ABRD28]AZC12795.1 GntR family transcriptional regulator [Microbacterium sp. ABRD28]
MTDDEFAPLTPREGTALGDDVYAVLGEAILRGTLRPGDRLRDVELASRLGVSRTPVREALQRLERLGLVEVAANKYTRVKEPHPDAYPHTTEFMTYVAGDAAILGLARATPEEHADLVDAVNALIDRSERDDGLGLLGSTTAFYQLLIRATANHVFITIMREAGLAIQRNLQGWTPPNEDVDLRTARYRRLRDAVVARDGHAAESILMELNHLSSPCGDDPR